MLLTDLTDAVFDCRRNELVALDLVVTAVSTMFAFVAMIGELLWYLVCQQTVLYWQMVFILWTRPGVQSESGALVQVASLA